MLVVFTVTGFLIAYAYKVAQHKEPVYSSEFEQREAYRVELIEQQERNKELADEVRLLQEDIRQHEQQLAASEQSEQQNATTARALRQILGDVAVEGQGIRVMLEDRHYDPKQHNPNDYIVHEGHVFNVINELKVAGAQAISVNGKRLRTNSYIYCSGPVIVVDGEEFAAPFVVEAIGDAYTLEEALRLEGGVLQQLVQDQLVVTLEQVDALRLQAAIGE